MVLGYPTWELTARRTSRAVLTRVPATWLFLFSFLLLIGLGTLGFLVLPGLYNGPRLGFVDSLFTATSAVCVTGLIVVDTATYFTPIGQAWIALLIQLGGLGILTFTTLIIVLLGRRATLGMTEAAGGHASILRHVNEIQLARAIVGTTLGLELIGAVLLWFAWAGRFGKVGAIWPAVFHAISAFCNAGFSTFSDSLVGFQRSPMTLLTIGTLIVLGGLGFIVLANLYVRFLARRSRALGTHTRLVLVMTGVLLVGGMVMFLAFEYAGDLSHLGWLHRATNALFMSLTPRTAGFNTVAYDDIANTSLFLTILFMIIGGSPGSTAGGLKTTTFALLGLALWSRLRGREYVNVAGRSVPGETVSRAAGLAVGGVVALGIAIFLLAMTEGAMAEDRTHFLRLIFEAHSAFGTVGLSMGDTTSSLSALGRVIIVCLMFVGRVGPLAIASAMTIAERRGPVKYRHPYEDVVIG
jgi:trk system potassium uptake protein TrkH